ncbi:MAG: hypothetical protein ACE3JK_12835 [Sporolactobacillus sp.]
MSDYRQIKKRLINRKNDLLKKLKSDQETADELGSVADIASGELSAYDNHPADSATQLYEREKDLAFDKRFRDELKDIEDALSKIEQGTYGRDEQTGERIPLERLEALPTARTIVSRTPKKHSFKERPNEESVIVAMEKASITNFAENNFDEENAFDLVSSYNDMPMIFEDAPYQDDEEGIGFVEDVEAIAATGIEGYEGDEKVGFVRNPHYDHWMDETEPEN